MDSEMMHISSNVLKHCTRSLTKVVCSYNYIEFAKKIVCITNNDKFFVFNNCSKIKFIHLFNLGTICKTTSRCRTRNTRLVTFGIASYKML